MLKHQDFKLTELKSLSSFTRDDERMVEEELSSIVTDYSNKIHKLMSLMKQDLMDTLLRPLPQPQKYRGKVAPSDCESRSIPPEIDEIEVESPIDDYEPIELENEDMEINSEYISFGTYPNTDIDITEDHKGLVSKIEYPLKLSKIAEKEIHSTSKISGFSIFSNIENSWVEGQGQRVLERMIAVVGLENGIVKLIEITLDHKINITQFWERENAPITAFGEAVPSLDSDIVKTNKGLVSRDRRLVFGLGKGENKIVLIEVGSHHTRDIFSEEFEGAVTDIACCHENPFIFATTDAGEIISLAIVCDGVDTSILKLVSQLNLFSKATSISVVKGEGMIAAAGDSSDIIMFNVGDMGELVESQRIPTDHATISKVIAFGADSEKSKLFTIGGNLVTLTSLDSEIGSKSCTFTSDVADIIVLEDSNALVFVNDSSRPYLIDFSSENPIPEEITECSDDIHILSAGLVEYISGEKAGILATVEGPHKIGLWKVK